MQHELVITFGIILIFLATTLGSALVFCFKKISPRLNTVFLGFASGIMVAASVFGLLLPALEESADSGIYGSFSFIPAAIGFLLGGVFLFFLDKIIPHYHNGSDLEEGVHNSLRKSSKLFLAVTIHNIPEGLAVGFAFGAASLIGTNAAIYGALALAIGVAIQNFPEGAAVSLPLKESTGSNKKAFLLGAASGLVEPIFAVVGFFLASFIAHIQPWLLAFSAGAMIYVVFEDLIPDAKLPEHPHLGVWSAMIGFTIMMVLDVALG